MRDRKHVHLLVVMREEHNVRESMKEYLLVRSTWTPDRWAVRAFGKTFERAIDF
jgi:hypothetical protein